MHLRACVVALALVTLVTASSAPARADKFAHTATAHPTVELSERSKPPAAHADAPAAPSVDADALLDVEALLGNVRVDEIATLEKLIELAPDTDPDKPDYYFRLAEIHAKRYRTAHLLAVRAQIAADREHDAPAKQKLTSDATANAADADAALLAAARTYARLTSAPIFRDYPKQDVALFYFAYTLNAAGRGADARTLYNRLLVEHPGSRFAPDAHLAFADYYFHSNQLADAEQRYTKVLAFPQSSQYWYADYMLGWVALNRQNPQAALETFYAVAHGTHGNAKQDVLRRAALHDFVRAYAEVGKADQAHHAFERVDPAAAPGMLEELADFYVTQGKSDRAIYVLRELMRERPRDGKVCEWEHGVAREMVVAGSRMDQVHEIEQLVRLYGALAKAKTLPASELSDCHDDAAEMSGQYARAFHQEAVKTRSGELLAAADELYGSYLAAFPNAADAAETRYFRAELAWTRAEQEHDARRQTQLWEDAADAFTAAVANGKLSTNLTKVAADAAMQAWMRALAVDPRVHDEPPANEPNEEARYATVPAARAIPANEQKLLAAFELYLAHVTDPHDDELADVKMMRAELLYRHDHLVDALAGFEDILAHHRDAEVAEPAAQLALDSYNLLHRYDDLFALVGRLEADPAFLAGKDRLVGVMKTLRRQGLRKQAAQLATTGHATHDNATLVACGDAYIAIYNGDPLADDAEAVLFASAQCYEAGKSLGLAIKLYEDLARLFPHGTWTARSLARLGEVYADVAYYRQAAGKLEDYARQYAAEADAFTALSNAVAYRKGVGDDAQAIADTELFIHLFGDKHPGEAAAAAWSLTAIYDKLGDADKLARHLRDYIARYGERGGADRLVAAWHLLGDAEWRASCPVATVDGTCAKVSRERAVREHAAREHADGDRTSCGDADKLLVTVVARDPARVQRAIAAYTHAVAAYEQRHGATGGDERGATYHYAASKLGLAERDFETYLASTIPTGLDFDPHAAATSKRSNDRFAAWFEAKSKLGVALNGRYEAVIALRDGATAIAAHARLGEITQSLAGQLFRAEIPRAVREGPYGEEASEAYCEALTDRADPLERSAVASYQVCLEQSKRLAWSSEWSRLCERELGELDPKNYPTAREIRRAPELAGLIVDVEPAVTRL